MSHTGSVIKLERITRITNISFNKIENKYYFTVCYTDTESDYLRVTFYINDYKLSNAELLKYIREIRNKLIRDWTEDEQIDYYFNELNKFKK